MSFKQYVPKMGPRSSGSRVKVLANGEISIPIDTYRELLDSDRVNLYWDDVAHLIGIGVAKEKNGSYRVRFSKTRAYITAAGLLAEQNYNFPAAALVPWEFKNKMIVIQPDEAEYTDESEE